ncbi:MAG TPA: multicopper oxidase family protein [Longimicrobiales bacterium]|nr:multicopper oxidase family protein [Longimicrobiales bacterium]
MSEQTRKREIMRRIATTILLVLGATRLHGQVAADLYTLELVPAPELQRFTGFAELRPALSPFTAPVTRAGVHRYDVFLHIDSLPQPRTLGEFNTYVVWAAPPSLRPFVRLGTIDQLYARALRIGEVAFNRFTIFISAEADARVQEPTGPFIMRGLSPSMRLGAAHVVQARAPAHEHDHVTSRWVMPPAHPLASAMYMPALHGLTPNAMPWLPDSSGAPLVKPRTLLKLKTGAALRLEAQRIKRIVRGRTIVMYGFNGQQPGPLLEVPAGAVINVNFVNHTAHETAVHWHGVRLDNRFDGVPHVTQQPVAPGDSFQYQVRFPDAGLYWYHPHHREDIQQDLGLYGNMLVREARPQSYGPAHREETLMLDDLLLGSDGLIAYGAERATHALMGRFGNLMLINGEPAASYRLQVRQGEVVRLFLTNVANTRTFNLSIPGAQLKVVGSDIGRFEHEVWTESVVLAPAERYIVDVMFERPGVVPLLNSVQSIDHTRGTFFPETDTLGLISVSAQSAAPDLRAAHRTLREHVDVVADVGAYRRHFARAPDLTMTLSMKDRGLPYPLVQLLQRDTLFFNPVEWSGTMPMMDWLPTTDQVVWTLRDQATGKENEDITWQFNVGDLVRIRLVNDRHTLHAMAHPIHIHGQRFLVLSVNGRPTSNHVWKDTVLVPVGSVVELLLEISNPGLWMIHCHIAEHLEAGMKTVFGVVAK